MNDKVPFYCIVIMKKKSPEGSLKIFKNICTKMTGIKLI